MGDDRLDQDEVALVLRRAAELDQSPAGPSSDDRLPVQAVEAAASEVGLPVAAVRQAVSELRAGVLTEVPACPPGPAVAIEAAVVPLEPGDALDAAGRWLSAQTFVRHRGRDGVEVWRVREDWIAALQRRFDWSASVRLKEVREVIVRAVAVEGGTLLRLEATLTGVAAAAPGIGASGGAAAGAGIALPAAALGEPVVALLGVVMGGAVAVGGWLGGRSFRQSRRDRVADELAGFLDRTATGIADRNALDRLRFRARRHRGGSWA